MNTDDWAKKIFSESELEELNVTSEKVVYDSEHGIVVNIGLSNDMCVDLIQAWEKSHDGHFASQLHMLAFIEGFIDYLRDYLNDEGYEFDN